MRVSSYEQAGRPAVAANSVANAPCVLVVDDDEPLRDALGSLFRSVGYRVQAFGSAAEFMRTKVVDGNRCLVLDVRMPGISGLSLQNHLNREQIRIPVIFMTGHGDIPMSVQAMKDGAVDFLSKPFRDQDMLDAVSAALRTDRQRRDEEESVAAVRAAFASLTARERDVMKLVTAGLMNKQIAGRLDIAEVTVKIHRCSVMKKMAARSLPDLVRMAESLGLGLPEGGSV